MNPGREICHPVDCNEGDELISDNEHDIAEVLQWPALPNVPDIITTNQEKNGVLIYFGIKASLESGSAKFHFEDDTEMLGREYCILGLHVNVDGVPVAKSVQKNFWPILGRFHKNFPFEIALYYGRSKPRYSNKFLKKFVSEINDLQDGFLLKGKKCRLFLINACCDSPARSLILNTPYFNSTHGCHKCHVVGEWRNHRMCFLDIDAPARTREEFLGPYTRETVMKIVEGVKTRKVKRKLPPSILLLLSNFDPVKHCILDSLHVFDLGVMKKLLAFLCGKKSEFCLLAPMKMLLSHLLEKVKPFCPDEFQRKPRTLDDLKFFKGKEYRTILLYLGAAILQSNTITFYFFTWLIEYLIMKILSKKRQI